MDANTYFFQAWDKWQKECRRELAEKGFNPYEWEISENGDVYGDNFHVMKAAVTPWKESKHYQE